MLKKALFPIVVAIILFLDWTALQNIFAGKSNTTTEYVTLIASFVVVFTLFASIILEKRNSAK